MENKIKKGPCVVINCGDGPHPDPKKDCCDPCHAVKMGWTFVGFEDVGYITPVATEVAAQLIVNPIGSGKELHITERLMSTLGSDDDACLTRYYFDPQLQDQGKPGTIVNLHAGSPNLSVAQIYSLPVAVSNGVAIDAFNVGVVPYTSEKKLILEEGHNLLVTYRANAENTRAGAFVYWTECPPHLHDEDEDGEPGTLPV